MHRQVRTSRGSRRPPVPCATWRWTNAQESRCLPSTSHSSIKLSRCPWAAPVRIRQTAGWYADLFYNRSKSIELDPTIADVHTQPTDADGNDVGHVLHVATGTPQLMVVTVDNCTGSQAYVGLASTYYEHVTDGYERLTDSEWADLLQSGPQPRPAWLPDAFVP